MLQSLFIMCIQQMHFMQCYEKVRNTNYNQFIQICIEIFYFTVDSLHTLKAGA